MSLKFDEAVGKDFFDYLGIDFNKTLKPDNLKKLIDDEKNKLCQGRVKDEKKRIIQALDDAENRYIQNGILTKEYEADRLQRLELSVNQCTVIAKSLTGKKLSNKTINSLIDKLKLPEAKVKEIFKSNDVSFFDLKKEKYFDNFDLEKIEKDIKLLQNCDPPQNNGSCFSIKNVSNLYNFVAYINGGEKDSVVGYNTKSILEILNDKKYNEFSTKRKFGGYYEYCANIITKGKTVMKDDEQREKYDKYLLFSSNETLLELRKEIELMKGINILSESIYADSKIKIISSILKVDEKDALLIYNNMAGVEYEPDIIGHNIFCGNCGAIISKYNSDDDAIRNGNKCPNCQKTLFKRCPDCGTWIPDSNNHCSCGHNFLGQAAFDRLIKELEYAVKNGSIIDAEKCLKEIRNTNAGSVSLITQAENAVMALKKKYQPAFDEIDTLISQKAFYRLQNYYNLVLNQYNGINIDNQKQLTEKVLKQCDLQYNAGMSASNNVEKSNKIFQILEVCSDYQPAIDFLTKTPPQPVSCFYVKANDDLGTINLSWASTGELNVCYSLIRKEGKNPPINSRDGVIIAKDITDLGFTDKNIVSGKEYSYGILTKRNNGKIYSNVSFSNWVILKQKIQNLKAEYQSGLIRITWQTPQNCRYTYIRRTKNGTATKDIPVATSAYNDSDIVLDAKYEYDLYAIYEGNVYSQAVKTSITPVAAIGAFSINVNHIGGRIYDLDWSINKVGIDMEIWVNDVVYCTRKSETKPVRLQLDDNKVYTITARENSSGSWKKCSNPITLQTFKSYDCNIDIKDKNGSALFIFNPTETLPANASEIVAFIRTGVRNQWISPDEAVKLSGDFVVAKGVRFAEYLLQSVSNEYHITLFTVYLHNGKRIYSSPVKKTLLHPVSKEIVWKVISKFNGSLLSLTYNTGRKVVDFPGIVLRVPTVEGGFVSSSDSADGITVFECKAEKAGVPSFRQHKEISIKKLKKNQKVYLFTDPENIGQIFDDGFDGTVK